MSGIVSRCNLLSVRACHTGTASQIIISIKIIPMLIAAQTNRNAITSLICVMTNWMLRRIESKTFRILKNCGSIVKKREYYDWDDEAK